jgi:hypothetical protein
MRGLQRRLAHLEQQCYSEQGYAESEQGQMDQFDDAHIACRSGQRRGRCGICQVRLGWVLVVVPAVAQSHPPSVTPSATALEHLTAYAQRPLEESCRRVTQS